ncbi:oligosaccharide repeat unit polymerase [Gammaproteobacteria bacterium]|nr:oligosaccharide repeat unit polymerase [Gammaproteobacteria bacterium]
MGRIVLWIISPWLLIIFSLSLYQHSAFVDLYFFNIIFSVLIISVWTIFYLFSNKIDTSFLSNKIIYRNKISNQLYFFVLFVYFIEILLFNGFPLYWVISNRDISYSEFGISGLHGFVNGIWLYLISRYIISSDIKKFSILILFQIAFLHRFTILFAMLAFIFHKFAIARLNILSNLKYPVYVVIIFSGIGIIRNLDFDITSSANSSGLLFQFLLWPYFYIVSPISNFTLSVLNFYPEYNIFPNRSLNSLIPTIFRETNTDFNSYLGVLAHSQFNTGTGFMPWYFDWGFFGIFIYLFIFMIFILMSVYYRNIELLLLISVACFFSIAVDFLFTLPFAVACLLAIFIKKRV